MKVRDFSTKKLTPTINAKYKHLLPTALTQESCSFIIDGCSNAVANGIRRTIACELKVLYLTCKYESIVTSDPFIIPEMIQKRLRMIPLLQSTSPGAKFSLDVTNNTLLPMDVKTGSIKGKIPGSFDSTYTLLTLGPGHSLQINDITCASEYGYVQEYGMCSVAFNAVSICKDIKPVDVYEEAGRDEMGRWKEDRGGVKDTAGINSSGKPAETPATSRSQMADPRVWEIKFNTNGTMSPRDIIRAACAEIIARLKKLLSLLYTMVNNESQYTLTIQGESDTIGNLIVKTTDEMYPDVEAVTYIVPSIERSLTIKIIYSDDINTLYKNVVSSLIATYEKISNSV